MRNSADIGFLFIALLGLLIAMPAWAQLSQAPSDVPTMQNLALQGDSNAQLNLGNYYATPQNAAPDFTMAAIWYRKAADQGNAEAQYRLGDLYYRGKGVPQQSYEDAYFWFTLASRAGPAAYAVDLDETARHLTDAQIAAIKQRADDWKPVSSK